MSASKIKLLLNVLATILMQACTVLVAILATPFLINKLGKEYYGYYVSGISLSGFSFVVCDLGLTLYLVKETSISRGNLNYIGRLLTASSIIKIPPLILMGGVFSVLYPGEFLFSTAIPFWLVVVSLTMQPTWLFQGVESLKSVMVMTLASRCITLVLLYVCVCGVNDYAWATYAYSIPIFTMALYSFLIVRRMGYWFCGVDSVFFIKIVRESWHYYISRVFVSVYSQASTFIVSRVLSVNAAAIYAVADQFYKLGLMVVAAIAQAVYPYMAYRKDVMFLLKLVILLLCGALVLTGALWGLVDDVVVWYAGVAFNESAVLIRAFMIVCVISLISSLIGLPLFATIGMQKYANIVSIFGAVLYLVVLTFIYFFYGFNLWLLVVAIVVSEFVALLLRVFLIRHYWWRLKAALVE